MGYIAPVVLIRELRWYPPEGLTAIFYLPALLGVYMVLLHTVVNGWSRKKHRYKNIISTSMMKLQGRQTVNNMLVMTVLIAGAFFAAFYTPMLGTGAMMDYDSRPVDYAYFYRNDQNIPGEAQVRQLAEDYGVNITFWAEAPMIRMAVDGEYEAEYDGPMGTTYEVKYSEQMQSKLFLSESSYEALTGERMDLEPGHISGIMDSTGSGQGIFGGNAGVVTNYITGEKYCVNSDTELRNDVLFGRYVCDDSDFEKMAQGLPDTWQETMVFFNVENCEESYDFAKALFNAIVDASGPEVEQYDAWDPVVREREIRENGEYFMDMYAPHYDQRDSSDFRLYWKYMPQFRVLDKADFVRTTAVFLMLFVFIAIVCFTAVYVIAFTRCMTIALNNRRVYEDMEKLGASKDYLFRSVQNQIVKVFSVPSITGTTLIYAFYAMIMYFNDNRMTLTEIAGMGVCLLVVTAVSIITWLIYRLTLKRVCAALKI